MPKTHHLIFTVDETRDNLTELINKEITDLAELSNHKSKLMTDIEYKHFKANLIRRLGKEMNGGTVL